MAEAQPKIKIFVDHRETKNHVFSHLKDMDAELACEQLKTGDFVCSDRVVIERKTVSDFVQSMIDRRIFRQVAEMKECFEKPVLIIEGDSSRMFSERDIHPNAIRGALASIAIDHRIPIIWTSDARETAEQIYWIARREQSEEKRTVAIRCPEKKKTTSDHQEFLIAGLPDINTKLGRNLLKKFKTPKRVFSAKPEHLMKVEGIGEVKARKIWELLNSEYEEKE
jgi:Fanconi anemia group M protein